jgi:hypothetical protein
MSLFITCSVSLAVVALYYIWRKLDTDRVKQEEHLRERVAYLVWMAATESEGTAQAKPSDDTMGKLCRS